MLASLLQDQRDAALLLMRIALGVTFIVYGWNHVTGLEGFTQAFGGNFGMPAPGITAPLVAFVELLGGIAVLVGVLTRYASLGLAVVMIVAMIAVKWLGGVGLTDPRGWGLDLALLGLSLGLLLMGPGAVSLERGLAGREL